MPRNPVRTAPGFCRPNLASGPGDQRLLVFPFSLLFAAYSVVVVNLLFFEEVIFWRMIAAYGRLVLAE